MIPRSRCFGVTGVYIVLLVSVSLTAGRAVADYATRAYYGAKFEPPSTVLHGAGQTYSSEPLNGAFERYGDVLGTSHYPLLFMDYNSINSGQAKYDALRTRLDNIQAQTGRYVIPQFGLYIPPQGMPDGQYEAQLQQLADGLKSLNRPVYLRIGYEFNGVWYDPMYQPATYKHAFRRVVDKLRDEDVPAASVWCAYPGYSSYYGSWNYLDDYYPGDDYVDWWGLDVFSPGDITASTTRSFLSHAEQAEKPVMIGEATPRWVGATDAQDWNTWFEPFFGMIEEWPGIKAHSYISWDWGQSTQWPTWGNAAIEDGHSTVRANYLSEMANPIYEHAGSSMPWWAPEPSGLMMVGLLAGLALRRAVRGLG